MSKKSNLPSGPYHRSLRSIVRRALCLAGVLTGALSLPVGAAVLPQLTPHQLSDGTASLIGHYDPDQSLRLVIGLQVPHPQEEEQFLRALQDKNSPLFHKYLTAEQWNARFAPPAAAEQAVMDWATSQGLTVTNRYSNRLLVDLQGPASKIEQALGVNINAYQVAGKPYFSNDRDPQIPDSLAGVIQSVGGLNNIQVLHPSSPKMREPEFPAYSPGPAFALKQKVRSAGLAAPNKANTGPSPNLTGGGYDPSDIWSSQAYDFAALYNLGHCCNPLGNPDNPPPDASIAIATAGSQSVDDLLDWASHYGFWAHGAIYYIDGTPPAGDSEGTMDFEWSSAMANSGVFADTALVYLYDAANTNFATFTDVYNAILNGGQARVFTTSWGCEEQGCTPLSSMQTDHNVFNQMVGQGWTLIAAAGDGGAVSGCREGIYATAVGYPASDPDVLAAGGTTLTQNSGAYLSEGGWSGGPDGCDTNDGGSTGGLSNYFAAPSYQSGLGYSMRAVPDMALNADWYNSPQTVYFGGTFYTDCQTQGFCGGGTSIVAPELAGFFAQENAYLLYVGSIVGDTCGGGGSSPCAPLGDPHYAMYSEYFSHDAPHYPFYDITWGCNNNDVTADFGLSYYCAGPGYDLVTGLGSANMLQLAWAINWYLASDFGAPAITFSGPTKNKWYNKDQVVSWTVNDTTGSEYPANGVAGFTQSWDYDPGDATSEPNPGSGNSFFSGPQYPNYTAGCLDFTGAQCAGSVAQGCHTVHVRAWDNTGLDSGDQTYGPICYDSIAPVTTVSLSGKKLGTEYEPSVTVTLKATDGGSGVASIWYKLNSGAAERYTGPFKVSKAGSNTVIYYSLDKAGNEAKLEKITFKIK